MVWAVVIAFFIAVDQISKFLASSYLRDVDSIPLVKNYFELMYVENRGAAFGILQGATAFFIVLTAVISAGILYYLCFKVPKEDRVLKMSLSLIFAGAVGNLIDRVRLGYVVDFFYFHIKDLFHWPVFNVADSIVVIGVIILLWNLLKTEVLKDER